MIRKFAAGLAAIVAASAAPAQNAAPAVPDSSLTTTLPGTWRHSATAVGSEARFYDSASRAQLVVTCNRAQRLIAVSKPANAAAPYLQFWTTSQSRNVLSSFDPATRLLTAGLAFNDGLLDAMVMSRGRIAIGVAGQPPLVVPPWGEVGRIVEDCRS